MASGAVNATVTPASTSSIATSPVIVNVTGLTTGQVVIIERFVDANGDGVINAGEFLAEMHTITDGVVSTFGGVAYPVIPGDEDGVANGQISVSVTPLLGPELGRLAGAQLIRVSSPTSAFAAFIRALTITQPVEAQSISGSVTSGGNPVPFASVVLLDATSPNGELARGVVANALGQFTVNAAPGSYNVAAFKSGFLTNFNTAPLVVLGTGGSVVQNIQLTAATTSISGKVADNISNVGLGGVQLFVGAPGGLAAVVSSSADGTYSAPVTADQWQIQASDISIRTLGYLKISGVSDANADTTGGTQSGKNLNFAKVTAVIHGTVTDSNGVPVSGIRMGAHDDSTTSIYDVDSATDVNGHYVLGVNAGPWTAYVTNNSPGVSGFVLPSEQSLTLAAAQAVQANFVLRATTGQISGYVKDQNNQPVVGVQVSGDAIIAGTGYYNSAVTDASGHYSIPVCAASWSVDVSSDDLSAQQYIAPAGQTAIVTTGDVTVNFIAPKATTTINGFVRDAQTNAPIVGVQVTGGVTLAGVDYFSSDTTDATGHYSLPVSAGSWDVWVSSGDLQLQGYLSPSQQQTIVGEGTVTLNFLAPHATATIHGTVKTPSNTPMPFVQVTAREFGGLHSQASTTTDANGNYFLGVTVGSWDVGADILTGSIAQRYNVIVNTAGSNVLQDLVVHPITAHLRGQVRDNHNNPVPNLDIVAHDFSFVNTNSGGTTDAGGYFDLGVYGGESPGVAKTWQLQLSEPNFSFVSTDVSFDVHDGVDVNGIDYRVYVVTSHLRGQVVDENSLPIANIAIVAYNQSLKVFNGTDVDGTGHFDIPVFGGTWTLGLSNIQGLGIIQQQFSTTVADNADLNNLVFHVIHTTATINGTLKDTHNIAIAGVQVFANATAAGIDYFTYTTTDAGGGFSIPVFSQTWSVSMSGDDLQAKGYQAPPPQSAFVNTGTVTLNFVAPDAIVVTQASWRQQFFGSTANSGDGADLNDYDKDGLPNIVEYAFGLNPKDNSAGQLPQGGKVGGNFVISFTQPSGITGVTYGAEWNSALTGTWTAIPDTGTPPQHLFSVPVGSNTGLFVRLKVSAP
ncbi:MAG: carboxypeptidase-like regulatory domain-containing protein [Verrucomicrobiaceae bacterium]|nr:carboxypeptidase-like regulatory domain-containing protein [Verrucomicrobiaceae bacterium]